MMHWYAFQSKARKERLLCEQLRVRRIETFFPHIQVCSANSRALRIKPYFPGYIFGHFELETAGRSFLDWIPGAVGIVSFGGEAVSIPDYFIHILRQHLEKINASGTEMAKDFQPGDKVAVHEGPFAGYEGVFNSRLPGRDRVEVLLKMLQGTHIRVELSIQQITLRRAKNLLSQHLQGEWKS